MLPYAPPSLSASALEAPALGGGGSSVCGGRARSSRSGDRASSTSTEAPATAPAVPSTGASAAAPDEAPTTSRRTSATGCPSSPCAGVGGWGIGFSPTSTATNSSTASVYGWRRQYRTIAPTMMEPDTTRGLNTSVVDRRVPSVRSSVSRAARVREKGIGDGSLRSHLTYSASDVPSVTLHTRVHQQGLHGTPTPTRATRNPNTNKGYVEPQHQELHCTVTIRVTTLDVR